MLGLNLNHVSKSDHRSKTPLAINLILTSPNINISRFMTVNTVTNIQVTPNADTENLHGGLTKNEHKPESCKIK